MRKKKIFRNILLSMMLCCVVVSTFAPCAFASTDAAYIATINATQQNYRNGPGLSYQVTGAYYMGEVIYLTGEVVDVDGYTWYRVATTEVRWVANVNSLIITPVGDGSFTDTITGYDAYGDVRWTHTCTQSKPLWYYHLTVENQSYTVSCDCGWFYKVTCDFWYFEDGSYSSIFLGLDTDNDEFHDLKPGQTKDLPCRANSNMRPYQILEFYGDTNNDPPTVTIRLRGSVHEDLVFNWNVKVELEPYGLKFTRNDGSTYLYPISGEYMVLYTYRPQGATDVYLAEDKVYNFKHGELLEDDPWFEDGRHVFYTLKIIPVEVGTMSPLDWVTYITRKVGTWIHDLLDFFGLGKHLTSENSPFTQLFKIEGLQGFFGTVKAFFDALPKEVMILCTLPFIGFLIIGLVRWLL